MVDTQEQVGVTVTDRAAQEVKNVLQDQGEPDAMLRIYVAGGGCSGLQYGMALETEPMEGDRVFEHHGVKIVIDPQSYPYLQGVHVDYVEGLMGAGFKIDNPNAAAACGCGSSFSPAEGAEDVAPGCGGCAHAH